jgi:hypothetical protein
LLPSAPAASASGPSQPIITTSVVVSAVWMTLVRIIGHDSESMARTSSSHAWRVTAC